MGVFLKYKSYVKNAGIYLAASLITSLLSLLINPLIAINLSPEDYATIGYYTSFVSLFTPLVGFFIVDFYLKNYYSINIESLENLKGNIIKLLVVFSGIVSMICLLGLYIYTKLRSEESSFDFFPYAILVIAQLYVTMLYNFQVAEYKIIGKSKAFFKISIFYGIINVIFALLFVVIIKCGATGKLFGTFLSSFVIFIYAIYKNRRYLEIKVDYGIVKEITHYSTPLVLSAMLGFFSNGYDRVLLERQGDVYSLGIYSVAFQISAYLNIFASSIKSTFQPDVFKAVAEKNLIKIVKVALATIGLVSIIVFVFIAFCPFLINILTAGRYIAATDLTRILSLSVVTSTFYYQISQITYASGLTRITLLNKIIGTIFTILLLIYMINKYGAIGAAWGMVSSYLIYAIGNVVLLIIYRRLLFK